MPIPMRSQSVKEGSASSKSRLPEPSATKHNATKSSAGSNPVAQSAPPSNTSSLPRAAPIDQRHKHVRIASTTTSTSSRSVNSSTSRALPTRGVTTRTSFSQKPSSNTYQPSSTVKGQSQATKSLTKSRIDNQPKANERVEDQSTPSIEEEVLQLSIVHKQASKALHNRQQTVDANILNERRHLKARHDHVVSLERDLQQRLNQAELSSWLKSSDHPALPADRIRNLTFCISDITELTSESGLIHRLTQEFEEWYIDAQCKLHTYKQQIGVPESIGEVQLINPLSSIWHKQSSNVHDRLVICRQTLRSLGHATHDSILARVLQNHVMLVDMLINEIQLCDELQGQIIAQQGAWISTTLTEIISTQQAIPGSDQPYQRIGLWESSGSS